MLRDYYVFIDPKRQNKCPLVSVIRKERGFTDRPGYTNGIFICKKPSNSAQDRISQGKA
jgi:hypothetical protein